MAIPQLLEVGDGSTERCVVRYYTATTVPGGKVDRTGAELVADQGPR